MISKRGFVKTGKRATSGFQAPPSLASPADLRNDDLAGSVLEPRRLKICGSVDRKQVKPEAREWFGENQHGNDDEKTLAS